MKALSSSGLVPEEESLSTAKLDETYGPLREQISASVGRQEPLMARVQEANQRFSQAKSGDKGAERESILKMLASAHDTFMELKGNLEEGTKVICRD